MIFVQKVQKLILLYFIFHFKRWKHEAKPYIVF